MRNGKNSKRKKKAISSVFIVLQQHSNRNVTHRPDKKKYGSAKDEQTKRVYTMRVYIRIHIYTYIHIHIHIHAHIYTFPATQPLFFSLGLARLKTDKNAAEKLLYHRAWGASVAEGGGGKLGEAKTS